MLSQDLLCSVIAREMAARITEDATGFMFLKRFHFKLYILNIKVYFQFATNHTTSHSGFIKIQPRNVNPDTKYENSVQNNQKRLLKLF